MEYAKAAKNRSATVTKVAIVRVNTTIRRWGLSRCRIRLVMRLAQIRTNAVAATMVMAGFMAAVTAKVGHMPRSCR